MVEHCRFAKKRFGFDNLAIKSLEKAHEKTNAKRKSTEGGITNSIMGPTL